MKMKEVLMLSLEEEGLVDMLFQQEGAQPHFHKSDELLK
jgi:hypothetical protein